MSINKSDYNEDYTTKYEPRIELPEYRYSEVPEDYVSIQKTLNCNRDNSLDMLRYERYKELLAKKNFYIIKNLNGPLLEKLKGFRMCYVIKDRDSIGTNNTGVLNLDSVNTGVYYYRSGGFLVKAFRDYLQYKGFSGHIFHVQKSDIVDLWFRIPEKRKKDLRQIVDNRIILPRPVLTLNNKSVNKYTVSVNRDGINTIIKAFKSNIEKERFLNTNKYQKILTNGFRFEDEPEEELVIE